MQVIQDDIRKNDQQTHIHMLKYEQIKLQHFHWGLLKTKSETIWYHEKVTEYFSKNFFKIVDKTNPRRFVCIWIFSIDIYYFP